MSWVKYLLLFTMAVSSLGVGRDAFSDMDVPYDSTAGKLVIGNGVLSKMLNDTDERREHGEAQFHLAEAKLKHLGPSVHCGDDAMTLRVPGPRMPHFLVDRGDGTKVPVSELPASCGYSVKRVRRDVSLVAPYSGCGHVKQQGGSYVLPLLILGAPVQMSCPMTPPALPTVSCFPSGMVISLEQSSDIVKIKVDGSWQPLLLAYSKCMFTLDTADGALVVNAPFKGTCWEIKDTERRLPMLFGGREVTLTCPDTPLTTAVPQDPQVPQVFYPFPYGRPWYLPAPTTAATTTTTAAPQDPFPQQPDYPFGNPWWYPYRVPATQAPTTTTAAPQDPFPQQPDYPFGNPWWWYPYRVPATQAPTTTTAAPKDPIPQQPDYPFGNPWWWYPYRVPATQAPTTTTAAPKDPLPQQPDYPFGNPWWYPYRVPATQAPTTTTAAPKDPFPQQPDYPFGNPWWYPYRVPATQAPTTTTAAPKDPLPQQPMFPLPIFDPFHNLPKGEPFPHPLPYGVPKFPPIIPGYPFPTLPTDPMPAPPADLPKGVQYPAGQPDMYPGYSFYGPKQANWPLLLADNYPLSNWGMKNSVFARSRRSVSSRQSPLSYSSRR
ncbi:uncharacterized protein [Misgurnus anguillicaudatus]|uniref:uncharacterized protein n=1 Tax=Misgurnus anguillicaudatus TaxID=75329 RepID=UPI003CCFC4ED